MDERALQCRADTRSRSASGLTLPPPIPAKHAPPLQAGQRGVLVRRVEPTSPVSEVLASGDVVLR